MMRIVHVECLPDEILVKKLGITRKMVNHHSGKSRVFNKLRTSNNEIGMVDEDPGSIKTAFEQSLKFIKEAFGVKVFSDNRNNKILILSGKLEDWIITACKSTGVNMNQFGLPDRPNDLHGIINHRLSSFEKLIDHLKENNNPSLALLKDLLK